MTTGFAEENNKHRWNTSNITECSWTIPSWDVSEWNNSNLINLA